MKVHVEDPELKSLWQVEVHGYIGHGDSKVSKTLYGGENEELARIHLLQAHALSQAFPYGREDQEIFCYAHHVATAHGRLGSAANVEVEGQALKVWGWGADGWKWDPMSDEGLDATIAGARLWWFDERGAKRACRVEWSPEEKSWLDAFGKPMDNSLEDALVSSTLRLVAMFTKSAWDKGLAQGGLGRSAPRM